MTFPQYREYMNNYCEWPINTKHLMTGLEGNSEVCFPRILDWDSRETKLSDLLKSTTKQKQILKNAVRILRQHQDSACSDHVQQQSTFRG